MKTLFLAKANTLLEITLFDTIKESIEIHLQSPQQKGKWHSKLFSRKCETFNSWSEQFKIKEVKSITCFTMVKDKRIFLEVEDIPRTQASIFMKNEQY